MYCENCGKIIDNDSVFCRHCGSEIRPNPVKDLGKADETQNDFNASEEKNGFFKFLLLFMIISISLLMIYAIIQSTGIFERLKESNNSRTIISNHDVQSTNIQNTNFDKSKNEELFLKEQRLDNYIVNKTTTIEKSNTNSGINGFSCQYELLKERSPYRDLVTGDIEQIILTFNSKNDLLKLLNELNFELFDGHACTRSNILIIFNYSNNSGAIPDYIKYWGLVIKYLDEFKCKLIFPESQKIDPQKYLSQIKKYINDYHETGNLYSFDDLELRIREQ
jgi:hypothetical protein